MSEGLFSLTTPFTPPTTEEDELAALRLIRSRRVGPSTFHRLMMEHGCATAALAALPLIARAAGASDYTPCPEGVAIAEIRAARRAGARMLCWGQPDYPAALAATPDAPPILWLLGNCALFARPMLAVVGARNASSLGLRMARKLAEGLGAAGHVVVSGLARGIDAAAHAAALESGTVAVHAGGVDVVYPAQNTELAADIARHGLRVSEQPISLEPQARHFPMRNRIIAGLVRAVIVVEAAPRSGSLITARVALDLGRDVLAVPGHPLDGRAAGSNALIRDGAVLVRDAEDILAALTTFGVSMTKPKPKVAPSSPPAQSGLARAELAKASLSPAQGRSDTVNLPLSILDRLGPSPLAEDQLIRDLALPAAAVAPHLLELEMSGRIQRQAGGLLALVV